MSTLKDISLWTFWLSENQKCSNKYTTETYLGSCQTSMMKSFAENS